MPNRWEKTQIFHINLLKSWPDKADIPTNQLWARTVNNEKEPPELYFSVAEFSNTLFDLQHMPLTKQKKLLEQVPQGLCKEEPGKTNITTHNIHLQKTEPI